MTLLPTTPPADRPAAPDADAPSKKVAVHYEHSRHFLPILGQLGCSLLVSTYQAGKLAVVGVADDQLWLTFHNFERAMGVAAMPNQIAVGSRTQIWLLRNAPHIAPRLDPPGRHQACYLANSAHVTGEIQAHEMAWGVGGLWVVNTLFSCLCTLQEGLSFVPRWRPPFITALAAEDRCHLNGLAMVNGRPTYVTAMSETDEARGWRPTKVTSGCVIDVASGATVARGFAMPHSPRVYGGRLWLLDSGRGQLVTVDQATGSVQVVEQFPGYARGLAFLGNYAFVGLSKIRETAVFGGLPVADSPEPLKCAVVMVDLQTGRSVAFLQFTAAVEEIFDVQVLPEMPCPALSGPFVEADGQGTIWNLPERSPPMPTAAT